MFDQSMEYLIQVHKLLIKKKLSPFDYYVLKKGIELHQERSDDFYINELTQYVMDVSDEGIAKVRTTIRKLIELEYIGKYRDNEDERKVFLTFAGPYYEKYREVETYLNQHLK